MVVIGTDIHSMQWLKCRRSAGTVMASAGARAYNGVWEPCPQWVPAAKPLVRGSGVEPF